MGRAMKTRPPRTLLELCVARATGDPTSLRDAVAATPKGMRVAMYVVEWAIALAAGCEPEVRAVAAWWREPEATAYRRNRDFRELFPRDANPERLARQIAGAVDASRSKRRRQLGRLLQEPVTA
jgi:hypothetical protein